MCEMFGFVEKRGRRGAPDVSTSVSIHVGSGSPRRSRPLTRGNLLKVGLWPADVWNAALIRPHLTRRHLTVAGISLALLAVLCLSPSLLGDRFSAAVSGLDAADPGSLWLAAFAFLGTSLCGALAWRAALRASGSPLPVVDASARYAVGCGLNAVAPAHVGSAVRIALFGRVTKGGCWTVGGAAAAVGAIRTVWLGVLIAIGSMGGFCLDGRCS